MANNTRHFKIGSYAWHFNRRRHYIFSDELEGLFDFLVTGMQCTYDLIEELPDKIDYLVNRSEIDIVMAQRPVTESNMKKYNFNYPFVVEDIAFAVRKPEYSPRIMALFQTLSPTVWLSLLVSTILFTLVCYVALKNRRTLEDVFLHVLAICLNQEGNIVSKRAGEFILLCTWLVAMALFTLCFKSVLLSFLSFPPVVGVRTVPELAAAIRAGEYEAYTGLIIDVPNLLPQSPNEDIRVIGESALNTSLAFIDCLFLDLVGKSPAFPKKAYFDWRTYMSMPGLYVSEENMLISNSATFVKRDFCCKDEVDMLIHRFLASGIDTKIRRFREYYSFMKSSHAFHRWNITVEKAEEGENRKLTMTDLGGAFILLAAGHFLSICLLIIELLVKRREALLFKKKQIIPS